MCIDACYRKNTEPQYVYDVISTTYAWSNFTDIIVFGCVTLLYLTYPTNDRH